MLKLLWSLYSSLAKRYWVLVEQELNNVSLLLATYSPRRKFPIYSQNMRRIPEHHPRICGQVQPTKRKYANEIFSLTDRASVYSHSGLENKDVKELGYFFFHSLDFILWVYDWRKKKATEVFKRLASQNWTKLSNQRKPSGLSLVGWEKLGDTF